MFGPTYGFAVGPVLNRSFPLIIMHRLVTIIKTHKFAAAREPNGFVTRDSQFVRIFIQIEK